MSGFLCGLAAGGPVLIVLDDLHNAGDSTIELLHSLRTRITTTPLLVIGTVRSVEGAGVRTALRATAHPLEVGALPASAVASLATAAGHPALADEITNRTGGHALFVVELLRGLDAGTRLPGSLHDAVDERLQTLGDDAVLRAAAVLGSAFEPRPRRERRRHRGRRGAARMRARVRRRAADRRPALSTSSPTTSCAR